MRPPVGGDDPPRTRDLSASSVSRPSSFFLCSESDIEAESTSTSPPTTDSGATYNKHPTPDALAELSIPTSILQSSKQPQLSPVGVSQPVTPLMAGNPGSALSSTPTSISLHSMPDSDEEAVTSDAAASDASGGAAASSPSSRPAGLQRSATITTDTAPQLIMPSLIIPKRRPFTEKGRQMGHFKILLAGREGALSRPLLKPSYFHVSS